MWSTNVDCVGEKPLLEVSTYAGQSWLISPVASAVNEPAPARIQAQRFLLVLSGVAVVDVTGVSPAQWRHETVALRPDLTGPLLHAADRYSIPKPPGALGSTYWLGFQVEQWAPFAGLSAVFNAGPSVNSGFAVNVWRPNPFASGTDAHTNAPLTKLFSGIQADIAVRDSDAIIHRLSYNITLVGKVVFGHLIIT